MFFCALAGYLVGCINPAYLIGRKKGMDVRAEGSHNAGASNAMLLFGRKTGLSVMLMDILKTTLIVCIMGWLYPQSAYAKLICGSACVLGHMFPFHMQFKGGKGFACTGGMVLAYDWRLFLLLLMMTILVALLSDYVFFGALFVALAFPLLLGFFYKSWLSAACVLPASMGMFLRHGENFSRMRRGEELGFSWLWKKDDIAYPKKKGTHPAEQEEE